VKSDQIAALLPSVFRRAYASDPTLQAVLAVMERFLDPVEERLAHLDVVFDVLETDERFVPLLARWVDLEWMYASENAVGIPIGRLRALVGASHALARERGTKQGLTRFLEIATGVRGFSIDERAPDLKPFRLRVHVPQAAVAQMSLIQRIVNSEKPAYLIAEIVSP